MPSGLLKRAVLRIVWRDTCSLLLTRAFSGDVFADRGEFRSVIEFLYSLIRLVDAQELELFLDSITFDSLIVFWIVDDN